MYGRHSGRARDGVTLAEMVVAFGLLTFVSLVIFGLLTVLLQSSAKTREQAAAELLAESLLEKAAREGPPGWGVDGEAGVRREVPPELDGTRFSYQIDPSRVERPSTDSVGELWEIKVTVAWWSDEGSALESSRVGHGQSFLRATRQAYYPDSP